MESEDPPTSTESTESNERYSSAPPSATLITLNEDVLLEICRNVMLTDFRQLEQTCTFLHSFCRRPANVLAFFTASYGRPSALGALARFPAWSLPEDGFILNAILSGPRPPLYYIYEFIQRNSILPKYLSAAAQLLGKSCAWYNHDRSLYDFLDAKQHPRSVFFCAASGFGNEETLQKMLEHERFPLQEFMCYLKEIYLGTDEYIWMNLNVPSIRAAATLSNLRPAEPQLLAIGGGAHLLAHAYQKASLSEQRSFMRRMVHLCETTDDYSVFFFISDAFPDARAQARESGLMLAWDLRRAWAKQDLDKFAQALEKGVLSNPVGEAKEEVEEMVRIFWEDGDVDDAEFMEFWCQAIGLTQKHAPMAMKKHIFTMLQGEVLVNAQRNDAARPVLLDNIRKGILEWNPKPSHVLSLCRDIAVKRGVELMDDYLAHWDPPKTATTRKVMGQLENRLVQAGMKPAGGKVFGKLKRLFEGNDGDGEKESESARPPKRVKRARKSAG
ncbi:hypothetical protein HK104_001307 [Borealophlyctis nickersoniae]|nr:hypothetical protein HK104_001307 [Borealophlyctis nickersoniae]